MEVKSKISAQYLQNYASWAKNTGTWGVNTTEVSLMLVNISLKSQILTKYYNVSKLIDSNIHDFTCLSCELHLKRSLFIYCQSAIPCK